MSRLLLALALVVLCIVGAHGANPRSNKLQRSFKPKSRLVDSSSVAQLYASTDEDVLTAEIDAGTVFKSTSVMVAWQAATTTTSTIKEIHALAGGETGVASARTWVFDASNWSGFAKWQSNLDASDLATYGTINSETSIVTWTVLLRAADEPSTAQCKSYATALAATDLASAMLIAADFYTQKINMEASSTAYASFVKLSDNAELMAERFDSQCLGWKFFSYYDAPTTTTTSSQTAAFSD